MKTARGILFSLLAGAVFPVIRAEAQNPLPRYEFPTVTVTAARFPVGREELARSITVLDREQIARAPAASVAELLEYVAGLEVRQRGPCGVQADLGLRGGSFEQVLVVLDGVKVSDPQTGHHDLDLPVTLEDIERIEILRGPGASRFGPDALDGVVHIITRRGPAGGPVVCVEGGENRQRRFGVSLGWNDRRTGMNGVRLSLEDGASDGWRHNTDYRTRTLNGAAHFTFGRIRLDLFQGFLDKRFGANQFYSASFPEQWEHVRTSLSSATLCRSGDRVELETRLWWRRGWDEFLLVRTDPDFYRNRHTSDAAGLEAEVRWTGRLGQTAVGAETGLERIHSSSLGDHTRPRLGVFTEHRTRLGERFDLGVGVFACRYPEWGWEVWPGGDISLRLAGGLHLFSSVGRSFRVPSFTDLYYADPVNEGDPGLRPERAWAVESGARMGGRGIELELALFRRSGRDVIDWIRTESTDPWRARNIAQVTSRGLETGLTWLPALSGGADFLRRVRVGYTRLYLDHTTSGFTSRYVFDHLAHQAVLDLSHDAPLGIEADWRIRFEERVGERGRTIADLRIARRFGTAEVFLAVSNLFNTAYRDLDIVPLPRRWIRAGIRLGSEEQ